MTTHAYDDGTIICDDEGITVRRYYPWGAKRIPYASIRGVETLPLTGANKVRRWRIWGSGDFVHWWNLDARRPRKDVALVLDVGRRVRPTITPDDATAVARIIAGKGRG
ncbi:hypothetical protein ABH931_002188 [Streptacidiphilus sp. MAP12-33]|uniref:hypothetical protein n=1 Tax=Streptacidiphilus sp. MAP12-33 TaxID=3156266 RepID=UPI003518BCC7